MLKHTVSELSKEISHSYRKNDIFSNSSVHCCWCWLNWDSLLQLRTNSVVLRDRPFRSTTGSLPSLRKKTTNVRDLHSCRQTAIQRRNSKTSTMYTLSMEVFLIARTLAVLHSMSLAFKNLFNNCLKSPNTIGSYFSWLDTIYGTIAVYTNVPGREKKCSFIHSLLVAH